MFSMVLKGLGWSQTIPELLVIDFSIVDGQNHGTSAETQNATFCLGTRKTIKVCFIFGLFTTATQFFTLLFPWL